MVNWELTLNVRTCCKADADTVNSIMRKACPVQPKWRNRDYWANIFSNPSSKRYGYVIEKIDDKGNMFVLGFAIYEWTKPNRQRTLFGSSWFIDDFNCKHYKWCYGLNDVNIWCRRTSNKNLKHHWPKLSSFIIHFTDFVIHPNHRGKGYGTCLMDMMVVTFPNGTRFGLQVKETNIAAIKCFKKCGFVIKRKIKHYINKMVLISQCSKEQEIGRNIKNMPLNEFITFRKKTENTAIVLHSKIALCRKLGLHRHIIQNNTATEYIFIVETLCCLEHYDEISKMLITNKYIYNINRANTLCFLIILLSMKDKSHLLNMQCTQKILSYLLQVLEEKEEQFMLFDVMSVFYSKNIAQCLESNKWLFDIGLYDQKTIKEYGQTVLTQDLFEELLKLGTNRRISKKDARFFTGTDKWLYCINEAIVLQTNLSNYSQIIDNYTACFQYSTLTYIRVLCLRGLAVFCYKNKLYFIGNKVWNSAYLLSNGYMYPSFVKQTYPKLKRKFARKRRKSKCHNCGKPKAKMKACSDCMRALYCSRKCQKIAWRLHRDLCDKVWRDPLTRINCLFA